MRTVHFILLLILVVYDCIQPTHQGPVQTAKERDLKQEQDVSDYSLGKDVGDSHEKYQGETRSSEESDATSSQVEDRLTAEDEKLTSRGNSKNVDESRKGYYKDNENVDQQEDDDDSYEKRQVKVHSKKERAAKSQMTDAMKKSKRHQWSEDSEEDNRDERHNQKQDVYERNNNEQGRYNARKSNNEEEYAAEQQGLKHSMPQRNLNSRYSEMRTMLKLSQQRPGSQADTPNNQHHNTEEERWDVAEPSTSSNRKNRKASESQVYSNVNDSPALPDNDDDYFSRILSPVSARRMFQENDDDEDSDEDSTNPESSQSKIKNRKYGPKMSQDSDDYDDEDPFLIVPSRIAKRGMFLGKKIHEKKDELKHSKWSKTWGLHHNQHQNKKHDQHHGLFHNRHPGAGHYQHHQQKWSKVKTEHPHPLTKNGKTLFARQVDSDETQVSVPEDYSIGGGMSAEINNPSYYVKEDRETEAADDRKNRKESMTLQQDDQPSRMSNRILRESTKIGQNSRGIYW
ncbi:unnamed protein product [Hermetia illucens]|uniref:Uncharacterized protein n=1 Tax=Hermetia illucens TaxID=343691 RepID=A0A7R8UZX8_HERIL|nr:protein starmaker-like [Hermetia illucens]CAD7090260.1 unnamed protein product [Hermetia illucens]